MSLLVEHPLDMRLFPNAVLEHTSTGNKTLLELGPNASQTDLLTALAVYDGLSMVKSRHSVAVGSTDRLELSRDFDVVGNFTLTNVQSAFVCLNGLKTATVPGARVFLPMAALPLCKVEIVVELSSPDSNSGSGAAVSLIEYDVYVLARPQRERLMRTVPITVNDEIVCTHGTAGVKTLRNDQAGGPAAALGQSAQLSVGSA